MPWGWFLFLRFGGFRWQRLRDKQQGVRTDAKQQTLKPSKCLNKNRINAF